jgi:hypothetical protein
MVEKPRNERTTQIPNEINIGSPRKRPRDKLDLFKSSKNPQNN